MAKHSSGQRTFSSSSTASASSTASSPTSPTSPTSVEMKRQSSSGSNVSNRSDWERYSIGRHSNDWLFGGFSVRDGVKKICGKGSSN